LATLYVFRTTEHVENMTIAINIEGDKGDQAVLTHGALGNARFDRIVVCYWPGNINSRPLAEAERNFTKLLPTHLKVGGTYCEGVDPVATIHAMAARSVRRVGT
jgi:hypothetical protein